MLKEDELQHWEDKNSMHVFLFKLSINILRVSSSIDRNRHPFNDWQGDTVQYLRYVRVN